MSPMPILQAAPSPAINLAPTSVSSQVPEARLPRDPTTPASLTYDLYP